MVRLMLGPGKLSPWDYHFFRLWDDEALSWDQKREFIGDNCHKWITHQVSNINRAESLADKVRANAALDQAGIPTPRLQAVYHPDRKIDHAPVMRSASELAAFLRRNIDYPFFFKPVTSLMSIGAGLAVAYDPDSDSLRMHDDELVPVDDFASRVESYCRTGPSSGGGRNPQSGYLFQSVLTNHPEIAALCGETVACLRVYLGVDDRGPRILATGWKIPAPDSPADNLYRPGNFYADVDRQTGEIRRALRGEGSALEVFADNPYTGTRLAGRRLPHFSQVREMVLRGATVFPEVRYQGWDVAICAGGPRVIEVNFGSSFILPQLASGRGLATAEFWEFVARARKLNGQRSAAWPVSWNRSESIWRLKGVWDVSRNLLGR